MKNNVTIKDVARHADVSISTVSRVINNTAFVNDEIKQRVLQTIKELNYTPNVFARSLKGSSMRLIAYVVSNNDDPFFRYISRGIEETLFDNGYNLINCNSNFSLGREQSILNTLKERRVDGIIINTVGKNDEALAEMSHDIPFMLSNRRISAPDFCGDFVDFDNVAGMRKLTEHLLSCGHSKIALLCGPDYLSTAAERMAGFKLAMSMGGYEIREDYPYLIKSVERFSLDEGFVAAEKLMHFPEPPTAIIAANSEMALGAMKYCRTAGIRIPEDVSLCCYGDILHSDLMFVDVDHMNLDLISFGASISEMLLERIKSGNALKPREIRFPATFMPGNSVAKLRHGQTEQP